LSLYSITSHGAYSFLINMYWFSALFGGACCVMTISGITRILEYAAYLLLFLLTPLFGLRNAGMSHFTWSLILSGLALLYAAAGIAASHRRTLYIEESQEARVEAGTAIENGSEPETEIILEAWDEPGTEIASEAADEK